jgi:hypothetical protein
LGEFPVGADDSVEEIASRLSDDVARLSAELQDAKDFILETSLSS